MTNTKQKNIMEQLLSCEQVNKFLQNAEERGKIITEVL